VGSLQKTTLSESIQTPSSFQEAYCDCIAVAIDGDVTDATTEMAKAHDRHMYVHVVRPVIRNCACDLQVGYRL
jgi:hypothetical protein